MHRFTPATLTSLLSAAGLLLAAWTTPLVAAQAGYVGSKACAECHQQQYATFTTHSKKAASVKSVKAMAPKLTEAELQGCYGCHTTGYGQGGFESYDKTPHLADVGCETCHGPGAEHAAGGDPKQIAKPADMKACEKCHDASRVKSFNFKPLMISGAH